MQSAFKASAVILLHGATDSRAGTARTAHRVNGKADRLCGQRIYMDQRDQNTDTVDPGAAAEYHELHSAKGHE